MGAEKPRDESLGDFGSSSRILEEAVQRNDVSALRKLARHGGGFQSHDLRRLCWPCLLGLRTSDSLASKESEGPVRRRHKRRKTNEAADSTSLLSQANALPAHPDEGQVKLDVDRSFVGLLDKADKATRTRRQTQLQEIINATLRLHPQLHYFQGFHDIVSVMLLVLDQVEETLECVEQLALFRIRDSMGATMEPVMGYLRLLKRIVRAADPSFASIVERASNLPYFSLSWVLTLLSHDLPDLNSSARLFDFLLASNPAMMAYLAAALVLEKRGAVEDLQMDPENADDPAMLHSTLSKLPPLTASPQPTGTAELNGSSPEKDDISYWADPDVNTPAFQKLQPEVTLPASVSVDEIIERTLSLWARYPLDSRTVRATDLMGPNSCIFTYETDLSTEEAEAIVQTGTDVVRPESGPVAVLPFKRPLLLLLRRRRALFTTMGVAGIGIALAVVFGDRKSANLADLVWSNLRRVAGL